MNVTASTPFGIFVNCLKTKNWTDLEPDVLEHKFYAPGIGVVKEINLTDGEEATLIEIQE